MSDNFTPLPPVANSSSPFSALSHKQLIGGVLTLGLLVAIGSGVFLVNRTQTSGTKAYSTNECVGQGGFEWGGSDNQTPVCPPNSQNVGTIDSSAQESGDGQTIGSPGVSTGGNHVCCVPSKGEPEKTSPPPAQSTAIPQDTGTTPIASNPTKPPEEPSCKDVNLPQPVIEIKCPNGCDEIQQ